MFCTKKCASVGKSYVKRINLHKNPIKVTPRHVQNVNKTAYKPHDMYKMSTKLHITLHAVTKIAHSWYIL